MKKRIIVLAISSLFIIGSAFIVTKKDNIKAQNNTSNMSKNNYKNDGNLSASKEYIEGVQPLYIDGIVVVNKKYGLPQDYRAPEELEKDAIDAAKRMMKSAEEDGVVIKIRSGYRSYSIQSTLYNNYVRRDGKEAADKYSAVPGYSEHQTGLAFDFTTSDTITSIGDWFTDTIQAKWLYENAYKYGFIIRYPEGKEDITGYQYESWHYRYIGEEHSIHFAMNNLTLEEYLGLDK
ncbi:MAG: M15 family metallopeptidase [Peptostreptococcaceae bacterium]|nr:M15 family metallopeptidase [Peptostreptococcaceae bacterium]